MKTLLRLTFLSFSLFFIFLFNPYQIFTESLVQVVFWITGLLNFLLAVLVFDKVGKKNEKIIDLQNQIQSLIKEDNEAYDELLKLQEAIKVCEETNNELRSQIKKFENSNNWLRAAKNLESPHGALK